MKKALAISLSIVIPAYNEEDYIGACLDAIAAQSVRPDEVIVVDNNSTDKTAEIVRRYDFVTLITEKKQGLYYSRQRGMDAAKGDVICRIDADTIITKRWVEQIKRSFSSSDIRLMTGPFAYHDMPLPSISIYLDDAARRIVARGGYEFIAGNNMAIRRGAWELVRNELCNEPFLMEDIDIVQHLKEHGITPVYNRYMQAATSSRRYADHPKDFARYISGHTRTHEYHNQPTPWGVHMAEAFFSVGYVLLKPLHLVYDPAKRRPSLAYLRNRTEARPDPMNVK